MNTRSRIVSVLKLIGLFVVVPYLLAQVTIAGMSFIYPPPSKQLPEEITGVPRSETNEVSIREMNEIQKRAHVYSSRLEHTRFLTRSALIAVGIYYVMAIPAFIFIRRKLKNTKSSEVEENE